MQKKIVVAKTSGFCMGVKRAVDKIMDILAKNKGKVYTYGQLIHNPQVTELLKEKGVNIIENNNIPDTGTVVIRAHGIQPEIKERLEKKGLNLCDATCPYVKKVQRIISEYTKKGYTILIIGDKGHAEVESYLGYAKGCGIVLAGVREAGLIKDTGRYCVVAQSTQDAEVFGNIVSVLKKRLQDKLEIFNTICSATSRRQNEAARISREVDAMIVVGGRNSANTLRLFNKCKETGVPVYLIERPDELDRYEISKYETIGITAGASTPEEVIKEIVRFIQCKD